MIVVLASLTLLSVQPRRASKESKTKQELAHFTPRFSDWVREPDDHYPLTRKNPTKGSYTKEEGMQLPMVAIQTAKCKSLLKIATFSISAWAGEDWTFVALWFCVVVKSSGVLGECYLA